MTRYLKSLGLALVAIFAMSAMVASAASAQGKLTSDGPVTLMGTEIGAKGSGNNAATAFGAKTECFGSTGTGSKYNVTPHTFIPSGETTFTLTANVNQKECRSFLAGVERTVTINTNGCDSVGHIGETTGVDEFAVSVDAVCPIGKKADAEIFKTGTEHKAANVFCTLQSGSQSGLTGSIRVKTDTTNDDLTIVGTIEKITVEKSGLCGAGSESNAKADVNGTIKGFNAEGGNTGITVTE